MHSLKKTTLLVVTPLFIFASSCSLQQGLLLQEQSAKHDITAAINDYTSDDWNARLAAVKRASKYGNTVYAKNVILLMLLAAEDYHPIIQLEAISNLKNIKSESAVEILQSLAITDKDANVRIAALSALSGFNLPGNEEIFAECIESEDWLIRETAYTGLLNISPVENQRRYIPKIINGINDSSISVRIAVLTNIKLKDPEIYNEISKIIKNNKSTLSLLKASLSAARGYIFDDETRERLVKLLTHRNKEIRVLSLQALKQEKIELNL